ncbi:DUF1054 domain-containing protein [Robertmurraya korlensis]|uniref:DUF1054 domain-containing protein n=1 Tax=Robertmurraya korlensis TaxID=519977 RepID=UPI000825FFE1|nr:DUF1054 domain-containing protein [Robertmurraya korlensis]
MTFSGFTEEDFEVFNIDGLDARMDALKNTIRPKLEALGEHFSPTLSAITGNEIFPHVAKHARRTINPPKDTWVAFSSSSRGYKMLPHFQIGLWESHVFVWFAMIYEATNKADFGKTLEKNLASIYKNTPKHFVWSEDHMKPGATTHQQLKEEDLRLMFERLQTVKKAEILCGIHIEKKDAINMSSSDFLTEVEGVFKTLLPLYKLV